PRKGKGAFCRITYALTEVAVRKDCIGDPNLDCEDGWAFDLEISDAAVDPTYADCDAILCGTDVTGLDGEVITYAYGVFLGHPVVLARWYAKAWEPLAYPKWDESTGA